MGVALVPLAVMSIYLIVLHKINDALHSFQPALQNILRHQGCHRP